MLTEEAVAYFKGKSKLAAALGISAAAVSQWGPAIPLLRQYQLQNLTNGALQVGRSVQVAAAA